MLVTLALNKDATAAISEKCDPKALPKDLVLEKGQVIVPILDRESKS